MIFHCHQSKPSSFVPPFVPVDVLIAKGREWSRPPGRLQRRKRTLLSYDWNVNINLVILHMHMHMHMHMFISPTGNIQAGNWKLYEIVVTLSNSATGLLYKLMSCRRSPIWHVAAVTYVLKRNYTLLYHFNV